MRSKRNIQPKRHLVAIVGDGQTERIYFADVQDTDRPDNITIFPDQPKRIGNYQGVLERAISLTGTYDEVYALIDMDKVIQEKQQQGYAKAKAEAGKAGVKVLENNPCFEIWILLHFERTGRAFKNCESVTERIRSRYISNYDKSQRFLVAARLYRNHSEKIQTHAIPNATFLEQGREERDEHYPRAEIYRFFEWYFNRRATEI